MIEYNNYKYDFEGTAVKVWEDGAVEPFLYQPHNPVTGKLFSSIEEAEEWVIDYLSNR